MPKFFTDSPAENGIITIQGEDAAHLRLALRVRPGEKITVCDSAGRDCLCEIAEVTPESVFCTVLEALLCKAENAYETVLFLALTKGDKFEFVIQKAVELGADKIVPVLTERCISRPDARDAQKKAERWQKISESAAKQCGRGKIPEVSRVLRFEQALEQFAACALPLFCYENSEQPLSAVLNGLDCPPESAAAFIGPEGGFSPDEANKILAAGGISVSLGARILRAETAPLVLLAALGYAFGTF